MVESMLESVLKAKIHRAVVTEASLDYEGSIAISKSLLDASGIRPYEQVLVANFTNGERWWTYAIPADEGVIGLNGGSARMGVPGDVVAIFAYVLLAPEEDHCPRIILVGEGNGVRDVLSC
jgi:aspartate 1-decarboxylase